MSTSGTTSPRPNPLRGHGGEDGGGLNLAAAVHHIAAAATPRVYGGEGSSRSSGFSLTHGPAAAHQMPRDSAHPSRPAAGRTGAGRDSACGVSSLAATVAANFPAAALPDAAAGPFRYATEFWRRIALPRAHPDAMRLSAHEDRMIGNGRAAGLSFADIARDICERRIARSNAARRSARIRWSHR